LSHHKSIEHKILDLIPTNLLGETVLDVGVGEGLWGFLLRTQKRGNPRIIGVEPFEKHIQDLSRVQIYDEIHHMKGQQYLEEHPETAADIVLLLEVVEHDSKENSLKLIERLEKRVKPGGIIIISTPDGFSEGAEGYAGNDANKHMSGWNAADFRWRGYTVLKEQKGVNWGFMVNTFAVLWYFLRRGRRPVTKTIVAYRRRLR
jgi:2-polyprenyl-3-methyl-5-hydroxy-6-metoxy-1,4-benzoquinol methylase